MGSFANSLFKVMLGWLQTAVAAVWSAFTSENGSSVFNWIGSHWILLAGILCVVGLMTDLCVYVFRWKPYKVWKSFFTRNRDADDYQADEIPESVFRAEHDSVQYKEITESDAESEERIPRSVTDESGLSRWEADKEEGKDQISVQYDDKPVTITNAGYIVPADSPYRRPADEMIQTEENEISDVYFSKAERKEPSPIAPRRRKRINVSELFSDPEEELHQFDAPQHVIDSRKAYRDPVYPRGWKKNEDKEE